MSYKLIFLFLFTLIFGLSKSAKPIYILVQDLNILIQRIWRGGKDSRAKTGTTFISPYEVSLCTEVWTEYHNFVFKINNRVFTTKHYGKSLFSQFELHKTRQSLHICDCLLSIPLNPNWNFTRHNIHKT